MISRDNIAGTMYGVALGDALGRPTEFMDLSSIYARYGNSGHMKLPQPALFTDDTQMTLSVASAIWNTRNLSSRKLARALRKEFIKWSIHDEPRAPGITCLTAIRKMDTHPMMSWMDATVAASKGCGANMRVAPAAFINDCETALGVAQLQAAMTHGHPIALAATELTALAIRWAALDMPITSIVNRLLAYTVAQQEVESYRREWLRTLWFHWPLSANESMKAAWRTCMNTLLNLQNLLLCHDQPNDVCRKLGGGWVAEEALALGLYFAVTYENDPVLAISEAARTSGDSDSIASIAGAIIGAKIGENAWPRAWRDAIERQNDIEHAIDTLTIVNRTLK